MSIPSDRAWRPVYAAATPLLFLSQLLWLGLSLPGCNDGGPEDDDQPSQNPDTDADGDGVTAATDCNDLDPNINPNAPEVCDGADNNCDGQTDENLLTTWYRDQDGDGYGLSSSAIEACTLPTGYSAVAGDCDDVDAGAFPGSTANECSLSKDMNCDGAIGGTLTPGGSVVVDVAPYDVTFHVTLAGAAISSANASSTDYGAIRLRDVVTGNAFKVGDLWDIIQNAPHGDFTAPVLPGTYDILYSVKLNGSNAPDNEESLLQAGLVVDGDQGVSLNLAPVDVQVSVTLGGKSVSNTNTSLDDFGRIALRDTASGEKFPLFDTFDLTTQKPVSSYKARLLPGTYDVIYENQSRGVSWPLNSQAVISYGRAITSNTTLALDVPVVNYTTTLTLAGQSLSKSNTSDLDYGRLDLIDAVNKVTFKLTDAWDAGGQKPAPQDVSPLIPGTYDVSYTSEQTNGSWPVNNDTVLIKALALTKDATQTIDIPSVQASISVTLGGQAISTSNTSGTDYGSIRLRDAANNSFKIIDTYNLASFKPVGSQNFMVIPGTYALLYATKMSGSNWPLNEKVVLKTNQTVAKGTALSVDVLTAHVTCDMTLNGQAVSTANTSASSYGTLDVRDVAGDRFQLCGAWDPLTGSIDVPAAVTVIPGTYDVIYDAALGGASWPGNQEVVVQAGASLRESTVVKPNIQATSGFLGVTIGGRPVNSGNTSALDFGVLEVTRQAEADDTFAALLTYDITTLSASGQAPMAVMAGTYSVTYQPGQSGGDWPNNQDYNIGCFKTP